MTKKIIFEKVTLGVFWLEIPEIDFRLLCGSPENVVKHLIKGNYIRESDTPPYETGPNAILLSDNSVQGGNFANLCEFPILHMWYKQGFLIPNSPNHGRKPLLIGSKEKIASQIRYIMMGNYGLQSIEELEEAGASNDLAKIIYDWKMRFAFGKFRAYSDILDYQEVTRGTVECEGFENLSVRRIANNVFEISYKDESQLVDLNLQHRESYIPPYDFEHRLTPRITFGVLQSGQCDAWAADQPCMNSIIQYQGGIFLVDAPPNIQYLLDVLGISMHEVQGVFITHCHDDHFAGLTNLIQSDKRITILGASFVIATIAKKFDALLSFNESMEETRFSNYDMLSKYFEIAFLELDEWRNINGLEVKASLSPHPVETTILNFRVKNSHLSWFSPDNSLNYSEYAHLADVSSIQVLDSFYKKGNQWKRPFKKYPPLVEEAVQNYQKPVSLKKIDIGGGLIHGVWQDFESDKSDRIIWAHTGDIPKEALPYGEEIAFGTLIPLTAINYGEENDRLERQYLIKNALRHLILNFDIFITDYRYLNSMLVGNIRHFQHDEVLFTEGDEVENLYLILTGTVIKIDSRTSGLHNHLPAGHILGESAVILHQNLDHEYRTLTEVRVLEICRETFSQVVEQYKLSDKMRENVLQRSFLQKNYLFRSMSSTTLNKLLRLSNVVELAYGEHIINQDEDPYIFIIQQGSVRYESYLYSEAAGVGDVLGEDFFKFASRTTQFESTTSILTALDATRMIKIPYCALNLYPILLWRFSELYYTRISTFLQNIPYSGNSSDNADAETGMN